MTARPECIQEHISLAPYTTFKIGGIADYLATIQTEVELMQVYEWAHAQKLPVFVFGGGSNIVFSDAGYRGVVVRMNIKGVSEKIVDTNMVQVTATAGEVWDEFVSHTVSQKLSGLENLSGIPGSVGAAPVQNIGAYGVEVGDRITSIRAYDPEKNIFVTLQNSECNFSYRHSFFKTRAGKKFVIVAVTFLLDSHFVPVIEYVDIKNYFNDIEPTQITMRDAVLAIRNKKFPDLTLLGTAGSFFKNPVITNEHFSELKKRYPALPGYRHGGHTKVSAGWLIDNIAQYKGIREGGVGTYHQQALVFINYGSATAEELKIFSNKVSNKIFEITSIRLEREVCFVSEKNF